MFKKFDKKKFWFISKINVLIILLLILIAIIPYAYSRYESTILADARIDVAIYLLDEGYQYVDVELPEILPQSDAYTYVFTISNYKDSQRTDTTISYDLSVITTTNLPLEYDIYENMVYPNGSSAVSDDKIEADSDGTFFRTLSIPTRTFGITSNQTNMYTLVVKYGTDNLDYNYQGMIESVRIVIDSKQVLDTDA